MRRFFPGQLLIQPVCFFVTVIFTLSGCSFPGYHKTTLENLKTHLGNPDYVIIDVREARDWAMSELKIKGAVRENPNRVATWAGKYSKDGNIVVY